MPSERLKSNVDRFFFVNTPVAPTIKASEPKPPISLSLPAKPQTILDEESPYLILAVCLP